MFQATNQIYTVYIYIYGKSQLLVGKSTANGPFSIIWLEQCHKPPMTGKGKHTTYKNGDDWG